MIRREFISLMGITAAWPLAAGAQQPVRPIFGILLVFSQEAGRTFTEPLRTYMQALGYVEEHGLGAHFTDHYYGRSYREPHAPPP